MGRASRNEPVRARGLALPVRILELQIAWIYLATGLEKMSGTLWPQGIASYYALQLEHTFGRAWARALATNMTLVPLMTLGTLAAELAFLPLVMLPSCITRIIGVLLAAGLHLGILFLMNVGNFPVIMLSALVLFLPAEWIDRFASTLSGTARARLARRALASADGATREVTTTLPRPVVLPRPELARRAGALALSAFAGLAVLTAVPTQLDTLRPRAELGALLRFLSVDQRWDMFAPEPARSDGWMRMPAVLADGSTVDLLTGGAADDNTERYSDPLYSRWAKVQERVASAAYTDYRLEYARQFCRSRNLHLRPGQVPLTTFEVHYV